MSEKKLDEKEETDRDRGPTDIKKEIVDTVKRHINLSDTTWRGTSEEKDIEYRRLYFDIKGVLAQHCHPLVLAMLDSKQSKGPEVSVPLSDLPDSMKQSISKIAKAKHISEDDVVLAIIGDYLSDHENDGGFPGV